MFKKLRYYHNSDKVMIYSFMKEVSMITIRPVSDLRNKFTDIEKVVNNGEPVFLTKNGYGSMVVMSVEAYSGLTRNVEKALDEADEYAANHSERLTHDEVFGKLRRQLNG